MKKKDLIELTPAEMADAIRRFIASNELATKEGKKPLTVYFEGEAGVGKTSVPKQVAQEDGLGFHSLVLSQIEDIGDLVGFPFRSFEMINAAGEKDWFGEGLAEQMHKAGWSYGKGIRTQYAEPEWVNKLHQYEKSMLLIDDFTRADNRFQQAIMQLIQDGAYYGWKLPKNCTIVLTSNPNDEDYFVNAQDVAMSGRYCQFKIKFDIKNWVEWATINNIDTRCINIMIRDWEQLLYSTTDKERMRRGKFDCSPRDWSQFFQFISNIPNFNSDESLAIIQKFGHSFVGDKITFFTTALSSRFDELPEPADLMSKSEQYMNESLLSACGSTKDRTKPFKAEIAAAVILRLQYYLLHHYANKPLDDTAKDRLIQIMESESITEDLKMQLALVLHRYGKSKFNKVFTHENFRDRIVIS